MRNFKTYASGYDETTRRKYKVNALSTGTAGHVRVPGDVPKHYPDSNKSGGQSGQIKQHDFRMLIRGNRD